MTFWIVLRDLGFILAALIYAISVAAGSLYYARYRAATQHGMTGRRKRPERGDGPDFSWIGALPAHVWLGSLAVGLWLVPLVALLIVRFSEPPAWWGLPFVVSGELALLASLASVVRYELRLIR